VSDQYNAIHYKQCNTLHCNTVQFKYNAIQHNAMLCNTILNLLNFVLGGNVLGGKSPTYNFPGAKVWGQKSGSPYTGGSQTLTLRVTVALCTNQL